MNQPNDQFYLPHLVQVCEAVGVGRIPNPEATKEFYDAFNPDTVLALLRRLMAAEESIRVQEKDTSCRHGDFDTPLDEGAKE